MSCPCSKQLLSRSKSAIHVSALPRRNHHGSLLTAHPLLVETLTTARILRACTFFSEGSQVLLLDCNWDLKCKYFCCAEFLRIRAAARGHSPSCGEFGRTHGTRRRAQDLRVAGGRVPEVCVKLDPRLPGVSSACTHLEVLQLFSPAALCNDRDCSSDSICPSTRTLPSGAPFPPPSFDGLFDKRAKASQRVGFLTRQVESD